jgi:hypothetical protein
MNDVFFLRKVFFKVFKDLKVLKVLKDLKMESNPLTGLKPLLGLSADVQVTVQAVQVTVQAVQVTM